MVNDYYVCYVKCLPVPIFDVIMIDRQTVRHRDRLFSLVIKTTVVQNVNRMSKGSECQQDVKKVQNVNRMSKRKTDRQQDRQSDRQTDRATERQTE